MSAHFEGYMADVPDEGHKLCALFRDYGISHNLHVGYRLQPIPRDWHKVHETEVVTVLRDAYVGIYALEQDNAKALRMQLHMLADDFGEIAAVISKALEAVSQLADSEWCYIRIKYMCILMEEELRESGDFDHNLYSILPNSGPITDSDLLLVKTFGFPPYKTSSTSSARSSEILIRYSKHCLSKMNPEELRTKAFAAKLQGFDIFDEDKYPGLAFQGIRERINECEHQDRPGGVGEA